MKILVVYETVYGNTQKLAEEMARALQTKAMLISEVGVEMINEAEEIVIGSPTHGGRPTERMEQWMMKMSQAFEDKKVKVFDTRMEVEKQNLFLKWLMGRIGYAAEKMMAKLETWGAIRGVKPQGFLVESKGGPIKLGEIEKAREWVLNKA